MGSVAVLERRDGPRPALEVVEPGRWVPPPPVVQRERWPWALAAVAWVVYVVVAWWLAYVKGFALHDAISKTAEAHHVIASRDPHLGAIGFYWMPLPQFVQIPFVLVLQRFGQAVFAGPLVSTFWGAFTIPVIAATARACRLSKRLRVMLTTVYAVSPIAIFASAIGMSEASSMFFLALVALGYARWDRTRNTASLTLMSLGLAGVMACRYEGLAVALAMAVICAAQLRREQWGRTLMFVLSPTGIVFVLWLIVCRLITGDALFWYRQQVEVGAVGASLVPPVLGAGYRLSAVGPFIALMVALFAAVVYVGFPLVLVRQPRRVIGLVGHWVPSLSFVLIVILQLVNRTTAAAPRYFYPTWMLAVTASFAMIGERTGPRRSRRVGRVVTWTISVAVLLSAVLQLVGFADVRVSEAEHEGVLFAPAVGKVPPQAGIDGWDYAQRPWRALFAHLDPELARGKHLMFDTIGSPQAVLFTRHPRQLVIPEDRDFTQTLDLLVGRVDYIAIPSRRISFGISKFENDFKNVVASVRPAGRWELDFTVPGVDNDTEGLKLYRWIPSLGAAPGDAVDSAPATTGPATSVQATTTQVTAAPAPTTTVAAVVTGPAARAAAVTGRYPTGQAWPTVVLVDGRPVLEGVVPTAVAGLAVEAKVAGAFGVERIANRLVVDPSVPVPSLVGVRLADAPAFGADSTITPAGEAVVSLWISRLQAVPTLRVQLLVARDGEDPTTASSRATAVRALIGGVDPTVVGRITVLTAAAPAGSPDLSAALATELAAP